MISNKEVVDFVNKQIIKELLIELMQNKKIKKYMQDLESKKIIMDVLPIMKKMIINQRERSDRAIVKTFADLRKVMCLDCLKKFTKLSIEKKDELIKELTEDN